MFSKDKDEIDDLFQEILMRLWKGYGSFRGQADVKTWLYRVSLNTCLNQDKKKRRRGERVPLSVDIDPFEGTDEFVHKKPKPSPANLRFAAWFSEPKVCRTIFKFALIIIV